MLKLEAPWYTYQKMVKALFERDKDIIVGDIYQWDNGKRHSGSHAGATCNDGGAGHPIPQRR